MAAKGPEILVVSDQLVVEKLAEINCTAITAGPSLTVGPGGDLRLQAPLVILVDGVTVEVGGTLTISNN